MGGFGGDVTILGRSFGLNILEALRERRETSFSGLMGEMGMNRATLSRTLGDLMNHGYVERRAYGRHRYYTATKKGLRKLEELKRPELTEDKIRHPAFNSPHGGCAISEKLHLVSVSQDTVEHSRYSPITMNHHHTRAGILGSNHVHQLLLRVVV